MRRDQFWNWADKSRGPDACWEWIGGRGGGNGNTPSYGAVSLDGKMWMAHRIALEEKLGRQIRYGMYALHTCDNPPCVNPAHLYEGTQKQNREDASERTHLVKARERYAKARGLKVKDLWPS